MKNLYLLLLLILLSFQGNGQTTTIITHGFSVGAGNDDSPLWLEKQGEAILNRLGGGTIYINDFSTGGWKSLKNVVGGGNHTILIFNWARISDDFSNGFLESAADQLFALLMIPPNGMTKSQFWSNTHKKHFIGHSRGGVLLLQLFHRLNKYDPNIKIQQYTSLDPHPATPMGDQNLPYVYPDNDDVYKLTIPPNVLKADNYYRKNQSYEFGLDIAAFDGVKVVGAYNNLLPHFTIDLPNCSWLPDAGGAHSKVHTWYHGTIDLGSNTDGECPVPFYYYIQRDNSGWNKSVTNNDLTNILPNVSDHDLWPYPSPSNIFNGDFSIYDNNNYAGNLPGWSGNNLGTQAISNTGNQVVGNQLFIEKKKNITHSILHFPSNQLYLRFTAKKSYYGGGVIRVSFISGQNVTVKYSKNFDVVNTDETFTFDIPNQLLGKSGYIMVENRSENGIWLDDFTFDNFILPPTGGDSYEIIFNVPEVLSKGFSPSSFNSTVKNISPDTESGNYYLTWNDRNSTGRGTIIDQKLNTTIPSNGSITLNRGTQIVSSPVGMYRLAVYKDNDVEPLNEQLVEVVDDRGGIIITPIESNYNFGNVNIGQTSWQTFRVTNASPTKTLTCDFGVTGNAFSSLIIANTFTLNPNEYKDIPISFKPTANQYFTGNFVVNGNFDGLTISKNLSGTGVTQLATLATDVPLGTDITLIDTKVGEYREATLTLTNTSTTDFTGTYDLDNAVFQGRVANQTGNNISVPAGQSRAIIIKFIPTDNGLTTGRLTILGNATNTPIGFAIRATGYGAATGACVSVSTLRITSNVDVSWTGTREFGRFTLTNNSSSKIATVHRLQFSGNDASKFSLSPNITSTTLNPNQSQEFIVYLTSNTPQGSYQGKVIVGVQDAGWDCAYYNIDLIGTAVQSVVNTPVLVYPENNKIHSYAGGYRFYIAFDILKKNIGASATYQLYLQDLTDNSVVYNHLDIGSFTGYGPDERCGWRSPSYPDEVTKLGHNYKWYIRAVNATNPNDFKDSDVRYFSVAAPNICKYPTFSIADILNNSANVSWQPIDPIYYYYYRLKDKNGTPIYEGNVGTGLSKALLNLSPNTTYKVDMRSQCSNLTIDEYTHTYFSPEVSFTTKPTPCSNVASIFPSTAQETCFGGSMQFNTNTVATSYQWYKDDLIINGATQSSYLTLNTGTYKVKVITSDGCEFYSNSVALTYKTQVSAPSVTSTTVNAGQTTSIIASGCTGTVNWYNVPNGGISLATGSTLNTTINSTATYFASCTSNACTSATRGSGTITINQPTITLGTLASTNYCMGNTISVPFTTTLPAGTVFTATLKKGTTTISSTSSTSSPINIYISYSSTIAYGTDYTIQITSGANSSTVSPNLTIGNIVNREISDSNDKLIYSNDYLCTGNSKVYKAVVRDLAYNVITTGVSYQWFKDGTAISGATSQNLTVSQTGTYTFIATQAGCSLSSNPVALVVNTSPYFATRVWGDIQTCTGTSQTIESQYYSNVSGYQWYKDGVAIPMATNRQYNATQSGLYKVLVTDGSCSGTTSEQRLTFGTGLLAPITASGNDTTICGGQYKSLYAQSYTINPTQYSYQWQKDGVNISGAISNSYSPTQAGIYSVTYTQGSCTSTSRGITIVNSTLAQKPVITAGNITNICSGSITINQNINGNYSYLYGTWYKDGVLVSPVNTTNTQFTATASGTYKMVYGSGACANESNTVTVNIGSTFTPKIYIPTYYGKINLCGTGDYFYLYFDNQNLTSGTFSTYQWQKDGVNIAGATNQNLYVTTAGNYTLSVSNGSCSGISNGIIITNNTPVTYLTASENNTSCTNKAIRLDLKGGNSYYFTPVVWKKDGVIISGETSSFLYTNQAGVYTATYNQNGCSGTSLPIYINTGTRQPGAIPPVFINSGQTGTLTVSGCTGTVNWYNTPTGGSSLGTGFNFTSPPLTLTTLYYADCSVNNCVSSFRASGAVSVNCLNMYSLKTGIWNDISVWSCGRLPNSSDIVTISSGNVVTIPNGQTGFLYNLIQKGILINNGLLKFRN